MKHIEFDPNENPFPERQEELDGRNPELFFTNNTEASLETALEIITALLLDDEPCSTKYDDGLPCHIHMEYADSCIHKAAKEFLQQFNNKTI